MANVQAKYLLSFSLTGNTYTIDDSTRDKQNSISADLQVNPTLISGSNGGTGVFFEYNNVIKINRIRIDPVGAPGLQRPYNGAQGYAALIYCRLLTNDGNNTQVASFVFRVPNYGDWVDCNIYVRPFESNVNPAPDSEGRRAIKLEILQYGTSFNYDGLNIDSIYVGENWNPVVMMDVETSGVYDAINQSLI